MAKTRTSHFGRGLFRFLAELRENNDRAWFQAHKERFVEEVEGPMLRFIADLGERLPRISKAFVADPRRTGGSMFRIYRDTRFSKDKSPFKCAVAAQFPHRDRDRDRTVPAFYLHLEPGRRIGGGGIYHPDAAALKVVRDRIAARPREWEAVLRKRIAIEGEVLKRTPAGYDPENPFVEDLRRKDYYSLTRFDEAEVCSPGFLDRYVETCAAAAPLVEFVTRALGLRW
jgi:uncharacterized protein (TIGR02453 family)